MALRPGPAQLGRAHLSSGRVVRCSRRTQQPRPRRLSRSSTADEPVVYGVGPYPEPDHDVSLFHGQRPVMQPHASGPKAFQPLEVQGRVPRVSSKQLVGFVSYSAYIVGKLPITSPKPRIGTVPHRSVQRPARRSSRASSASASRRPVATSSSIAANPISLAR